MSSCYALVKKNSDENLKGNAQFFRADEEMCAHFNVEPHESDWCRNWENLIGMTCAAGRSLEHILEKHDWLDAEEKEAVQWLSDNYTVTAWRQFG